MILLVPFLFGHGSRDNVRIVSQGRETKIIRPLKCTKALVRNVTRDPRNKGALCKAPQLCGRKDEDARYVVSNARMALLAGALPLQPQTQELKKRKNNISILQSESLKLIIANIQFVNPVVEN